MKWMLDWRGALPLWRRDHGGGLAPFSTLVRFDVAYYSAFRCNRQRITDYPNLWPYARDLFSQPGVAATVDFEAIKGIYFGSRPPRILPRARCSTGPPPRP